MLFEGASEATEKAGACAVVFVLKMPCVGAEEIVTFPAASMISDVAKCDTMNICDGSGNKLCAIIFDTNFH
jgi:hypothetical protein